MRWMPVVLMLSFGGAVSGANWYVDNQATGSNTGTSWENAWQGFDPISWGVISGGDTLFLSGGTDSTVYDSSLNVSTAGTEDKRVVITLSDEDGHNGKVIIKHGIRLRYYRNYITVDGKNKRLIVNQDDATGIYVYLCNNVTLQDIEVRGVGEFSWQHGIYVNYKSYYITISGCHIHGVTGDGININVGDQVAGTHPDDWHECYVVQDCIIDSCADDGLQVGSRITVKNCRIRYVSPAFGGIDPAGGHPDGIQTAVNAGYITIDGNTFINCMQGAFLEKTSGFVNVTNNIFYDMPERLPSSQTNRFISINESPNEAIGYTLIANNVFYRNQWFAVVMYSEPAFESNEELVIRNNIFLDCTRWLMGDGVFLRADNIFYTSPDAPASVQAIPDSGMNVDPLFSDYENYDFTLQEASPARNSGTNLSEYFALDFNKAERRADGSWDMGPYQYGGSSVSVLRPEDIPVEYRSVHEYYTITGQRICPERRVPTGIYFFPDAVTGQLRKNMVVK